MKKNFETPSADYIVITTSAIIATSAQQAPDAGEQKTPVEDGGAARQNNINAVSAVRTEQLDF